MSGLCLIVFPALGLIGVLRYIAMPEEKRSPKAKKCFTIYLVGLALTWIGFDFKGEIEPIFNAVVLMAGVYLSLFYGVFLFGATGNND